MNSYDRLVFSVSKSSNSCHGNTIGRFQQGVGDNPDQTQLEA